MNYHVLIGFLIWWSLLGLFFSFGSPYLMGATSSANLNPDVQVKTNDPNFFNQTYTLTYDNDTGKLRVIQPDATYNTDFIHTLGFVFFGLGLPSDTPIFFKIIFAVIITIVNILGVAFIAGFVRGG